MNEPKTYLLRKQIHQNLRTVYLWKLKSFFDEVYGLNKDWFSTLFIITSYQFYFDQKSMFYVSLAKIKLTAWTPKQKAYKTVPFICCKLNMHTSHMWAHFRGTGWIYKGQNCVHKFYQHRLCRFGKINWFLVSLAKYGFIFNLFQISVACPYLDSKYVFGVNLLVKIYSVV